MNSIDKQSLVGGEKKYVPKADEDFESGMVKTVLWYLEKNNVNTK